MTRVRQRWSVLLAAACGAMVLAASWLANRPNPIEAQGPVQGEPPRPGIVATYRGGGKQPLELVQLEPTLALTLKAGESPHPRLSADGGTVRYQGYLTIARAGSYRFSVLLRGKFQLTVAGKEVLSASVDGTAAALKQGPEVQLEPGLHALVGVFERLPGAARLQVRWQAPFFRNEPLPYQVVRHLPAQAPARLAVDQQTERGRFLAEEFSCVGCHRPVDTDRLGNGLQARQGPDLSKVGGRTQPAWVYHWLTASHDQFPGRVMPKMFGDDATGRAEAFAVTQFLATLDGPAPKAAPNTPKGLQDSLERGRRLFATVGCLTCHRSEKEHRDHPGAAASLYTLAADQGVRNYPLYRLGAKTTPGKLAEYLTDPLATDPSGRMPHLLLDRKEATDLANYLCLAGDAGNTPALPAPPAKELLTAAFKRVDHRADELAEFLKLPPPQQLLDLGKRLVIDRGCNSCHQIAPGGQPFANVLADAGFSDIQEPKTHDSGCLATSAAKRARAPRYALTADDRKALTTFLRAGATGAGVPSGFHAARVSLQRFNCLACHRRDGDGGLHPRVVQELRKYEKTENVDELLPPNLTGVGGKLRTPWLDAVLTQAGRARPWLALRMPQFGKDHVGHLPVALAALEGNESDDAVHRTQATPAKIQAGRLMIGKTGFGCASCHDIAGQAGGGTRGPDLATTTSRVRYDWYRRWLESAQRMDPGTKMPTVFPDGRSLLDNVLDGNPDAQADAMWAYLSLGPKLPLPVGVEPAKGKR